MGPKGLLKPFYAKLQRIVIHHTICLNWQLYSLQNTSPLCLPITEKHYLCSEIVLHCINPRSNIILVIRVEQLLRIPVIVLPCSNWQLFFALKCHSTPLNTYVSLTRGISLSRCSCNVGNSFSSQDRKSMMLGFKIPSRSQCVHSDEFNCKFTFPHHLF